MTLFSLLEDKVGPGVEIPHKSCVIHRSQNPFSNQTGLSNFVMYSTVKNSLTVNKQKEKANDSHNHAGLTSFFNEENCVVFQFSVFRTPYLKVHMH